MKVLEAIVHRLEASVGQQITDLRNDIRDMQVGYVSRSEFELQVQSLNREIARIEREQQHAESGLLDRLKEFKQDLMHAQTRNLTVAGLLLMALQVGLSFFLM